MGDPLLRAWIPVPPSPPSGSSCGPSRFSHPYLTGSGTGSGSSELGTERRPPPGVVHDIPSPAQPPGAAPAMRAQLALGCCVSFVLGMLELPRGARARDPLEQAPPLPSLLEDHPGTVPPTLARPTGSLWRRVIIPKPAPQLGAHLALQDKLLTPKLAPQHRLFAPRLSPGHGAHLAPWQRLLSPEMAPQLVARLAPQHKQFNSKFAPWHRPPTPTLASRLGARLAPQDNLLPLRLAPHLGAHLAPQHKPLIPKLAPPPRCLPRCPPFRPTGCAPRCP
ncbi:uncharacterized protein [Melanerpes formicivorus]|uniref:uncharacterized protein n=1 Tax=Melanerpes formicivorus TaxID=211600 RepID=UPI00358E9AD7